jgi:uncharacterized protein (TIGR03435 family)
MEIKMKTKTTILCALALTIPLTWGEASQSQDSNEEAVAQQQAAPPSQTTSVSSTQSGGQEFDKVNTVSLESVSPPGTISVIPPCPFRAQPHTEGVVQSSREAIAAGALPTYEFESTDIEVHDLRREVQRGRVRVISGTGKICDGWGAMNVTVRYLISLAFNVNENLISASSGWLDDDKFDVVINFTPETMDAIHKTGPAGELLATRGAVRAYLEDRLKLVTSHQSRMIPVYAIVMGKGPKFHEATRDEIKSTQATSPAEPPQVTVYIDPVGESYTITGKAARISSLVPPLHKALERPVLDRTGLTGLYDFTLAFVPQPQHFTSMAQMNAAHLSREAIYKAPIAQALEKQMGLKLELSKASEDVIVVDQIEKPQKK